MLDNISEHKKAAEKIKELNEFLEQCIAERTAELAKANEKLKLEIIERKRVEERLKASEKKSRAWLENSPICTKIVDLDFNLQYMSAAGVKDLKIDDITQFYGKPYPFDFYPESFRNCMTKNLEKVKETGEIITQEASVVDTGGNELWFHSTLVPVNDDEGRIDYIIIVSIDTTERKKMEEDLIKIDKLESLGILAGGIAHDFNNNLQGILGKIIRAMTYGNPKDEIHEKLKEAKDAVLQSRNLTQQLLTFSKGGEPVKKTISISKFINDSTGLALSGSNVRGEFYMVGDFWPVEADEGQLGQVVNNLIINAVQAMPEGGTIKVRAENINVGARGSLPLKEGKYVKISIEDQGIGISQEHLQKIFDPYFTTKEKGSGLGLAIVYSIIGKHDGHITAESIMEVGTTFHVYLPASRKEAMEKSALNKVREKDVEKVPITGRGKVLLMEDEDLIRDTTGEHLRRLRYEVETAEDGSKAVELYKGAIKSGKPFDAVIMDLTIPGGMGGKEAIKRLLEIDSEAKVIVVSGYANDPIMAGFRKYGFSGVIAKPYEIRELNEILQQVIMERS